MSNFKEAVKIKLRFETPKGSLSCEQLWDLTQADLARCIKAVKKRISSDTDDDLSFLVGEVRVNTEDELRFKVLKEVYLDNKAEADSNRLQRERKARNQKILAILEERKDEDLKKNKSIEELEAMLE